MQTAIPCPHTDSIQEVENPKYLQVTRVGQDCATAFHLTADVLYWRLLPRRSVRKWAVISWHIWGEDSSQMSECERSSVMWEQGIIAPVFPMSCADRLWPRAPSASSKTWGLTQGLRKPQRMPGSPKPLHTTTAGIQPDGEKQLGRKQTQHP